MFNDLAPITTAPRLLVASFLSAALLASGGGCAYNYAGQPGESTAQEESSGSATVVEIKQDTGEDAAGDGADSGGQADGPGEGGSQAADGERAGTEDSPCGVESFKIHFYDSSTRVAKTIDCAKRKVVSVNRSPISQSNLRQAQDAGLPENTWYVLVDPKGLRARYLSNDQLIKVSQQFELRFLGRDEERNLLIYEYRGDL